MGTQWEARIAALEKELAETRVALAEANRQIEELTRPQEEGKKGKGRG